MQNNTINKIIMKKLLSLLMFLLVVMKDGNAMGKLTMVSMLSLGAGIGSFIGMFFRTYVFPDANFIIAFSIMIMLDTAFGVLRHWRQSTFDPEKMIIGLFKKLIIGVGVMMFTKVLLNLPEVVGLPLLASTIVYFLKASIVSWLGLSFFGNVYIISGGKMPPKIIMERFEKFSQTLDTKDLISNDDKNEDK